MKNHLLSTLTRSLFCKNRTIPCVYLHNQCNRHFSDKSDSKDSQTTKGKDNYSEEEKKAQADAENEKFDELYEKFSKRQLEFQNIDNPPEYIDPATQENHYGLKRALRGLKQEAKRTWRRIQDPLVCTCINYVLYGWNSPPVFTTRKHRDINVWCRVPA
uniref:Uncharacterized protein n=1 Tax=Cacopsylla melanoneura TaxID=428564 RepID=A0A8D9BU69_9HEMI